MQLCDWQDLPIDPRTAASEMTVDRLLSYTPSADQVTYSYSCFFPFSSCSPYSLMPPHVHVPPHLPPLCHSPPLPPPPPLPPSPPKTIQKNLNLFWEIFLRHSVVLTHDSALLLSNSKPYLSQTLSFPLGHPSLHHLLADHCFHTDRGLLPMCPQPLNSPVARVTN